MRKVTEELYYVGVNDHIIDLFEGQYPVPHGMSYNSYIIKDDKIAVMDSVDINFTKEWLENVKEVLGDRKPDYLVVHHMEPDHSASLKAFLDLYPDTTIVGNMKTFGMYKQFFHQDVEHKLIVKENDVLNLGKHELKFVMAPFVHWPEVMMSYDSLDKSIFTADAFGKFGANDYDEPWIYEARRYYFGIVGKYGAQVNSLLNKIKDLDIEYICSLHGPVIHNNPKKYIELYTEWANYRPTEEGVLIAYTSIYGNTKKAVKQLEKELEDKNISVITMDLARTDIFEAISNALTYPKIVIASTTYNNTLFPFMNTFLEGLIERNFQGRKIGIINNGTWAPMVSKLVKDKLVNCKNLEFLEPEVKILSSMDENNLEQIKGLATLLAE